MAQTGLAVFSGEQISGFIMKIGGTLLGLVLGMAVWYIGAGRGNGNPVRPWVFFLSYPITIYIQNDASSPCRPTSKRRMFSFLLFLAFCFTSQRLLSGSLADQCIWCSPLLSWMKYGIAAATIVFVAPFMYARIVLQPPKFTFWMMTAVTIIFVVGYS